MSEITKLYENVGIEKKLLCGDRDVLCGHVRPDGLSRFAYGCYGCEYKNDAYPPFTAEKQLELIKWLGKNKNGFGLFDDGTEGLSCHCDFHWEWFRKDFYAEDFDNALAGLINSLWQDLTEQERTKIADILKG